MVKPVQLFRIKLKVKVQKDLEEEKKEESADLLEHL